MSKTEMQASPIRSKTKAVKTTLDRLDFGTPELVEADKHKPRSERKRLPEGVTSKELYGDVLRIGWPSFAELILTSLTSMVDLMMVSNLGIWATSAVSLASQPRFLFNTMSQAINTGSTALVARSRGAGDEKQANEVIGHALILALIIAVVGTIVCIAFAYPIIKFMGASGISDTTLRAGADYLRIQMYGFVFMVITMAITALLRGTGNSRPSMYYNVVVNIVKIIFNFIMIDGNLGCPAMGINGAAYATIISQAVGMFIAFYYLMCGKYYLKFRFNFKFRFNPLIMSGMWKVGLPAMIEQVFMRIGMIIFARTVASLGEVSFAAHNICMNIQSLSFMNGQAFAVSATTLIGQSLGKHRPDMAELYGTKCRSVSFWFSIILAVLFAAGGKYLMMLYTDDTAVLQIGAVIMFFVAAIQPFQSSQFVLAGALRGAGDTKATAVIILITVVFVRAGLALLFVNVMNLGIYGAWVAMFSDQLLRSFLVMLRYNQGKWKEVKLLQGD